MTIEPIAVSAFRWWCDPTGRFHVQGRDVAAYPMVCCGAWVDWSSSPAWVQREPRIGRDKLCKEIHVSHRKPRRGKSDH